MSENIYDHVKCKKCNTVFHAGTRSCTCGTALGVYGIPCTRFGVEKPRGSGALVGDGVGQKQETAKPPVTPPPTPPVFSQPKGMPKKSGFFAVWFLFVATLICFIISLVFWDDSHLDELGPAMAIIGGLCAVGGLLLWVIKSATQKQ